MAELIDRALLIYQEAGRLSDKYLEMAKTEHGADKRLLRAVAGFLVELKDNAAGMICQMLIDGGADQEAAAGYLAGLEREYKILDRLRASREKNQEESEAG